MTTNYVIEGDIDFYAELNRSNSESKTNTEKTCLLTGSMLSYNNVKLPCNHSFNYEPLFKEVMLQKTTKTSFTTDNVRLQINQIKCPYCRCVSNKVLPYIPIQDCKSKIKGVNSPKHFAMPGKMCQWIYKSGKRVGKQCCNPAYEDESGISCSLHRKYNKRNVSAKKHNDIPHDSLHASRYNELLKLRVVDLREMLRSKQLKVGGLKIELVSRMIESEQ